MCFEENLNTNEATEDLTLLILNVPVQNPHKEQISNIFQTNILNLKNSLLKPCCFYCFCNHAYMITSYSPALQYSVVHGATTLVIRRALRTALTSLHYLNDIFKGENKEKLQLLQ